MGELPVDLAGRRAGAGRPALGYTMVAAAAALWGINGTVTKVILASGLSAPRLTELRSTGALVGFGLVLAATRRGAFRLRLREVPFFAAFGVCGLSLVQWFYFVAIHRLEIGVALLIEYLAPLLLALFARFVLREPVRRRIWAALVLALGGLSLVVDVWGGVSLNGIGVLAALAGAVTFALYVLLADHGLKTRDPVSLTFYGFLFSALFWAIVQPWWSFPGRHLGERVSLLGHLAGWHLPAWALVLCMLALGTVVPFRLMIGALRHISPTRAGIVAMLEPVVASLVAYGWLGETLGAAQLVGGAIVLAGVVLAQTAR